jgi:hypothetical protein
MKPGDMFRYIDGTTGLILSYPFHWEDDLKKDHGKKANLVRVLWTGEDKPVVMSVMPFETGTAKII